MHINTAQEMEEEIGRESESLVVGGHCKPPDLHGKIYSTTHEINLVEH